MKERNYFWQSIRGLCILAVILIHCPSGSVYEFGSPQFDIWIVLRQFINFPVAIFIFLSGYFTNPDKCTKSYKKYILNRGGRLIVPFLIWSLFYSVITLFAQIMKGDTINVLKYAFCIIIGKASAPLYYIVVLIQLTLITPFLVQLIQRKTYFRNWLWLITPVYLIFIYVYNIVTKTTPFLYETLFPAWFIFYYLGLNMRLCPQWKSTLVRWFGKISWIGLALCFSLIEAAILLWLGCSSDFASSQIKVSSFLYAFLLILYCFGISQKPCQTRSMSGNILKYIGDRSYGIYFVHCFFLQIFEKLLSKVGLNEIWIVYFILCFLVVALCSVLFVEIARKIAGLFKAEKMLQWIGFN